MRRNPIQAELILAEKLLDLFRALEAIAGLEHEIGRLGACRARSAGKFQKLRKGLPAVLRAFKTGME